jgi:NADH dehydrogenase [ubiquinone] 1 alpha subcomplex assembly factor 5|tara:strand:- start:472 stop:1398 length:927 start_codon:yes stop_codon:yes gene_type:complete
MTKQIDIFDRQLLRLRRERATNSLPEHNFLFNELAKRLVDRLADIRRNFSMALDIGCHNGFMAKEIKHLPEEKISFLIQTDLSTGMAKEAKNKTGVTSIAADEEFLPFRDATFDLIISCGSLHHVNDLPGTLIQIKRALKPDGVFLAALFGGSTLLELRQAWLVAESAKKGGVSPRVSPFIDLREAAGLLQRAGFALPVADIDTLTVTYRNPIKLMSDLRGMGESNVMLDREKIPTRGDTLKAVSQEYMTLFANNQGEIPATFQIIYLTGWSPENNQPKALAPGSASVRLADVLEVDEYSTGESVEPY